MKKITIEIPEKSIHFTIPGEPMGKQRPRYTRSGIVYTPSETVAYEKMDAACFWKASNAETYHGAVGLYIEAYYGIPKSVRKSVKLAMLDGTIKPTKKPDFDNIEKIVADGLKKAGMDDDKQVVINCCRKEYSEEPRVEVWLWEI